MSITVRIGFVIFLLLLLGSFVSCKSPERILVHRAESFSFDCASDESVYYAQRLGDWSEITEESENYYYLNLKFQYLTAEKLLRVTCASAQWENSGYYGCRKPNWSSTSMNRIFQLIVSGRFSDWSSIVFNSFLIRCSVVLLDLCLSRSSGIVWTNRRVNRWLSKCIQCCWSNESWSVLLCLNYGLLQCANSNEPRRWSTITRDRTTTRRSRWFGGDLCQTTSIFHSIIIHLSNINLWIDSRSTVLWDLHQSHCHSRYTDRSMRTEGWGRSSNTLDPMPLDPDVDYSLDHTTRSSSSNDDDYFSRTRRPLSGGGIRKKLSTGVSNVWWIEGRWLDQWSRIVLGKKLAIILGSTFGGVFLLAVILSLSICLCHKKKGELHLTQY